MDDNFELLKRTVLGFRDFSGRSRRTEFFYYMIATALLTVVVHVTVIGILPSEMRWLVFTALNFVLTVPIFALLARRMHDQNRSGWWSLTFVALFGFDLVTSAWDHVRAMQGQGAVSTALADAVAWPLLACTLLMIVFIFWPGTEGDNRFGPDPRLE